jgi:alpha-glucosidase
MGVIQMDMIFKCAILVCGLLSLGSFNSTQHAGEYIILSPDKETQVRLIMRDELQIAIVHRNKELLSPSPISITIDGKGVLGIKPHVIDERRGNQRDLLKPVVKTKSAEIVDEYAWISLDFDSGYGLDVRVYDDGVAWRLRTAFDGRIKVVSEGVDFRFPEDHKIYFPTEKSFLTHCERTYEYIKLSEIPPEKMAFMPVLVEVEGGPKIVITEADLYDHPGMYLTGTSGKGLHGIFPAVALKENQTRDRTVEVTERADYIAETEGTRTFPWRTLVIADSDGELLENQMVYKLARPLEIEDPSWIRPGKVAWDWWNANNIYGVDFEAGINTATYKYYIDFASKYGIEYVILDEGWYELGDLFKINPEINMEELLRYAKEKNVGVILWVVWKTLDDQLEPALDRFESWGVKGIKVDFMNRDDQWMVNYYWKIAHEAAKHHLVVDFHGAYKPAGLRRAYPNVLTREGVMGLEHNKWTNDPTPEYNVTIPFIRMLAGPMDYTPGAMINANEEDFKPIFARPMSMGTRCHQLAMYVVFESPLQMLADSPTNYLREPECMEFLSKVPTVWDETKALDAKVGDYVLIARRSGGDWYVGAMTDWTPRELTVDLSFLGKDTYKADIYEDGVNARRVGNDFKRSQKTVTGADKLQIKLAPGGGWVARFTKP